MEPIAAAVAAPTVSSRTQLVRRAAGGDAQAFEALVMAGSDRAFRIARAILGNDSDARDATQDAFVAAWRDLPRLRDPGSFEAWLRRILVNACRAQLRDRRRIREISLDADPIEPRGSGPGLSESVGDTDMLARAFERLDADKRAILVLHYLDHEPVAAIASSLRIPAGTVKWRLSDARAALSRALTAEGEAPR
jgi:RNA polymerase sigma-70 factor (ECF subfamily)